MLEIIEGDMEGVEKDRIEESKEDDRSVSSNESNESEANKHNLSQLLAKLSECDLCLNPLQGSKVVTCNRCAQFWCQSCSKKLTRCPYCRSSATKQVCAALEHLIRDLYLPCRNQKFGCDTLLTADARPPHEASCPFGRFLCPLSSKKCQATLALDEVADHVALRGRCGARKHKSTPAVAAASATFRSEVVRVEATRLGARLRAAARTPCAYYACTHAHDALFVCEFAFERGELRFGVKPRRLEMDAGLRFEDDEAPKRNKKKDERAYDVKVAFEMKSRRHEVNFRVKDGGGAKETIVTRRQSDSIGDDEDANLVLTFSPRAI